MSRRYTKIRRQIRAGDENIEIARIVKSWKQVNLSEAACKQSESGNCGRSVVFNVGNVFSWLMHVEIISIMNQPTLREH